MILDDTLRCGCRQKYSLLIATKFKVIDAFFSLYASNIGQFSFFRQQNGATSKEEVLTIAVGSQYSWWISKLDRKISHSLINIARMSSTASSVESLRPSEGVTTEENLSSLLNWSSCAWRSRAVFTMESNESARAPYSFGADVWHSNGDEVHWAAFPSDLHEYIAA